MPKLQIELADGKYTIYEDGSQLKCWRHGKPWSEKDRQLIGDNVMRALFYEHIDLLRQVEDLKAQLEDSFEQQELDLYDIAVDKDSLAEEDLESDPDWYHPDGDVGLKPPTDIVDA